MFYFVSLLALVSFPVFGGDPLILRPGENLSREVAYTGVGDFHFKLPERTSPRTLRVHMFDGSILLQESSDDKISVALFGIEGLGRYKASLKVASLENNILDISATFHRIHAPTYQRPTGQDKSNPGKAVLIVKMPNHLLGHLKVSAEKAAIMVTGFGTAPKAGFQRVALFKTRGRSNHGHLVGSLFVAPQSPECSKKLGLLGHASFDEIFQESTL